MIFLAIKHKIIICIAFIYPYGMWKMWCAILIGMAWGDLSLFTYCQILQSFIKLPSARIQNMQSQNLEWKLILHCACYTSKFSAITQSYWFRRVKDTITDKNRIMQLGNKTSYLIFKLCMIIQLIYHFWNHCEKGFRNMLLGKKQFEFWKEYNIDFKMTNFSVFVI